MRQASGVGVHAAYGLYRRARGARRSEDETAAHWARGGAVDKLAQWLQGRSTDAVNTLDDDGMAPLHWAVDRGQTEAVRLLLVQGADANLTVGLALGTRVRRSGERGSRKHWLASPRRDETTERRRRDATVLWYAG